MTMNTTTATSQDKTKAARIQQCPPDAVMTERPELGAVYFTFSTGLGKPCAVGFTGRKGKPAFRYQFADETRRANYVGEWLKGLEENKRLDDEMNMQAHPFKAGDILYNSWGYEQTNINWFKVLTCTDSTLVIQEVAAMQTPQDNEHFNDRGTSVPNLDKVIGSPRRVRIQRWRHSQQVTFFVKICHGAGHLWDGKPKHYTSYA
jgi:hypothetical protein